MCDLELDIRRQALCHFALFLSLAPTINELKSIVGEAIFKEFSFYLVGQSKRRQDCRHNQVTRESCRARGFAKIR